MERTQSIPQRGQPSKTPQTVPGRTGTCWRGNPRLSHPRCSSSRCWRAQTTWDSGRASSETQRYCPGLANPRRTPAAGRGSPIHLKESPESERIPKREHEHRKSNRTRMRKPEWRNRRSGEVGAVNAAWRGNGCFPSNKQCMRYICHLSRYESTAEPQKNWACEIFNILTLINTLLGWFSMTLKPVEKCLLKILARFSGGEGGKGLHHNLHHHLGTITGGLPTSYLKKILCQPKSTKVIAI